MTAWTATGDTIKLSRDCQAIRIPSGEPVKLPGGTMVTIGQRLGGTYTCFTGQGDLVRISGKDSDALSLPPPAETTTGQDDHPTDEALEARVWEELRSCYDPEIPANIVDLGLVYDCSIESLPSGKHQVNIQMTLTAPGCGMGEVLKQDIEQKLLTIPTVERVNVQLVFDPPWDMSRMSEAAKLQLGFF